jgi:F0F1-type ATP synthase gamma subunit
MRNKQILKNDIDLNQSLSMLMQAFQEISVMKMQKARLSVLNSRQFLEKLTEVFYDVKESYRKQIVALAKKKKKKDLAEFSALDKNNKTISVLLSANTKLYGDIINKVFSLYKESVMKDNSDLLIIGRLGKELFDESGINKQYLYFEIPDNDVTVDDIKSIVYHLVNYKRINVYYGQFENVVNQKPIVANITGDRQRLGNDKSFFYSQTASGGSVSQRWFLFEPTLKKILQFFETQVFSSLFRQTVSETQLARYGSRITAMEEALTHIESQAKNLYTEKNRLKHFTENKKQLEVMSGISLWGR